MAKMLMVLGALLFAAGLFVYFDVQKIIPLGRLPGDIHIQGKNSSFYFPITTCVLISVLFSIASYVFGKLK